MDCKIIDLEAERDKRQRSEAFKAALEEVKKEAHAPVIGIDLLDNHFKEHPYKFPEDEPKDRK